MHITRKLRARSTHSFSLLVVPWDLEASIRYSEDQEMVFGRLKRQAIRGRPLESMV